jgi:putative membrane protein
MTASNKRYHLDHSIVFRLLFLFGFSGFLFYILSTGQIAFYVRPRIVPYIIFTAVVMILIGLSFHNQLFSRHRKKRISVSFLIFLIPLILAFAVPQGSYSESAGARGDVQLSASTEQKQETAAPDPSDDLTKTAAIKQPYGKQIIIGAGNFYKTVNDVYTDLDAYQGTPIEVIGFVFRDADAGLKSDQFVPARLMMVCCAADMVPVGLLCSYKGASGLKTDAWVKVTGTIGKTEYQGNTVPCINASTVEDAENADKEYIYPY